MILVHVGFFDENELSYSWTADCVALQFSENNLFITTLSRFRRNLKTKSLKLS